VSLPIEANIKALDILDKAYGKGDMVEKMLKNEPKLYAKVKSAGLKFGEEEKTSIPSGSLFIEDEELRRDLEEFRKRKNK
jgi:hypothetical protein